jgi:tRNA pseudouridine38-40 synthase
VQETLEQALSRIAAQSIRSVCAGRTDTGVHAVAQVVHFDDPVGRSSKAWVMGTNSQLPDSVRVHWALPVADDFHARFSALRRHYRYVIANTPVRPAHLAGLVTWIRRPLDAEAMHQAGQALLGEQDFSAFRAAACQSNSPFRNVSHLQVRRSGSWVWIDIVANAFLHHMVRNIAGSLIMVGEGHRPGSWIGELLAAGDRTLAADTADGSGLYLVGIDYPEQFALPENPSGPMFLNHPMTTDGGTGLLDCAAGSQE